jgi:hypothetical protein
MKRLKSGLFQAILSVLIGLSLTALVGFCGNQGWIPSYSLLILSFFNIAANIFTMNKMRSWGIFYTFGWLVGSFVFNALGFLEVTDLIFNIIIPMVILAARFILWVRNIFRKIYS